VPGKKDAPPDYEVSEHDGIPIHNDRQKSAGHGRSDYTNREPPSNRIFTLFASRTCAKSAGFGKKDAERRKSYRIITVLRRGRNQYRSLAYCSARHF